MDIKRDQAKALSASSRNSAYGRSLVGRLLTPVEIEQTSGANGSCNSNGYFQTGGTFTQKGGGYNQDGGSYNMSCGQGAGGGGGA
jgi:hypothetical protein